MHEENGGAALASCLSGQVYWVPHHMDMLMQPHPNAAPVTAQPFSEGWTLDDTRVLYEHNLAAPDFDAPSKDPSADQAWREQRHTYSDKLSLAIGRHVLHLAQTRGLVAPPYSEAVNNRFINAWRRAISGEGLSGWDAIMIGHALTKPVSMKLVTSKPKFVRKDRPAPTLEQTHAFIHETMLAGDFESYDTDFGGECENSGLHLSLTLVQWSPTLERFDCERRQFYPLAAGDITAPSLQHVTVPLPTGELLVADWFRHDAFTAITDKVLEDSPSISSSSGCEERTRRLATQLGIATVFVGNSCPSIQADANGVRIGSMTEEADMNGTSQGYVCTDLWWATMLDKQTLVDLFARTMPIEQAHAEVADLIVEHTNGITQVTLPPGEYHLYYAGDVELFGKMFDRDGVDLSSFDKPMLVLSRTELEPRPSRSAIKI